MALHSIGETQGDFYARQVNLKNQNMFPENEIKIRPKTQDSAGGDTLKALLMHCAQVSVAQGSCRRDVSCIRLASIG